MATETEVESCAMLILNFEHNLPEVKYYQMAWLNGCASFEAINPFIILK